MSSDRVPSRSEVSGWSPQQLADYLKRMKLSGCDKTVLKNGISGSRFVNLSENDLQKFPKLHAPIISKISTEISKKEEKRGGLFSKKTTPKYHEPDTTHDAQGWDEDEFDEFEDDYESPCSGDDEGSGGDYESPNDDVDDKQAPPRGHPPTLCPRPQVSTLPTPSSRMSGEMPSRRDPSPHFGGRPAGKFTPEPPQIFRGNKPGRDPGSSLPPIGGSHRNTVDRPPTQPWKPQPDVLDPPSWSKPPALPPSSSLSRSSSSARPSPNRFDGRREQPQDEAPKHNTFPLHNKGLPPRPGVPGPPSRHADSLPPSIPSAGSLPHKLQTAMAERRGSFSGADNRQPSFRPPPPTIATPSKEGLDPVWYMGKVTRGQAEGCLKRVNKDGAYLVRDSTRQLANQPYTLMVYYQGKVYNIQIRQQNQQFQLGTGLKSQESFPSVSEIIGHYSQSPLLLIDAKNRSARQQNECMLSDPAGYYMTGPNWS
ncbi:lymphocyte cytosolic protein 2a isoform X2 [Mastacembelus armatus]|uniref:lymphocyte cytosolic protein 2a isoform X2 n=1 Tax=Mastacembelus armatus TaxID=205130 RepID=UPI000E46556E|nr:lymphocyte cytosolic protein 2-like isoform X2 [Mastacembelus armatus]